MRHVPGMVAMFWVNQDTQSHYFVSTLEKKMPGTRERRGWEKVEVRPGEAFVLPHKFFDIHSRDGSPCKGTWMQGVEVPGTKDAKKLLDKAGLKALPGQLKI